MFSKFEKNWVDKSNTLIKRREKIKSVSEACRVHFEARSEIEKKKKKGERKRREERKIEED